MTVLLWILLMACVLGFIDSLGERCDRQERGFTCNHDIKRVNCTIALREKGTK